MNKEDFQNFSRLLSFYSNAFSPLTHETILKTYPLYISKARIHSARIYAILLLKSRPKNYDRLSMSCEYMMQKDLAWLLT